MDVAESYELPLDQDLPWENSLDEYGSESPDNPYINWVAHSGPEDHIQAAVIANLVAEHDEDEIFPEDEDEDTIN